MKKSLLFILFVFFYSSFIIAQDDIGIIAVSSPNTGCGLNTTEAVTVQIYNYSANDLNVPFQVSYSINGSAPITETIPPPFLASSVNNYTFLTKANLFAGGTYNFKIYTTLNTDIDHSNDTIVNAVINYAVTVAGTISAPSSVCYGSNGSLSLGGQTGAVVKWEKNEGNGWTSINNTTTTENFTNLTLATQYRVLVKNGLCQEETTTVATINIDPTTQGGTVGNSAKYCDIAGNGSLTLSGHVGNILNWEYSTNNGSTWNLIANTTTTETYSGYNQTHWYRAKVKSGTCPVDSSTIGVITIITKSAGGTLTALDSVCTGSNGTVSVNGNNGSVAKWQSSSNGGNTWTDININTTSYNYKNLLQTTLYRVIIKNDICPEDTSSDKTITVSAKSVAGTVTPLDSVCALGNQDTLILTGKTGKVLKWQLSTNGTNWIDHANTTEKEGYLNLTQTTYFRTLVKNGVCPNDTSAAVPVLVYPATIPGKVDLNATVCSGKNGNFLTVNGANGKIIGWQSSSDNGATWNSITNNTPTQFYLNLNQTTQYRAIVQSGTCPLGYSIEATINVLPSPVAKTGNDTTILEGTSVKLKASGNGVVVLWTPSISLDNNTLLEPIATPTITTTYNLIITALNGCTDTASITVFVTPLNDYRFVISNILTPNNDGYNDTWYVENIEKYSNSEVYIYNSYGQEVYHQFNYQNDWAGTAGGSTLPDGTYYYVIKFKGVEKLFKGSVDLFSKK